MYQQEQRRLHAPRAPFPPVGFTQDCTEGGRQGAASWDLSLQLSTSQNWSPQCAGLYTAQEKDFHPLIPVSNTPGKVILSRDPTGLCSVTDHPGVQICESRSFCWNRSRRGTAVQAECWSCDPRLREPPWCTSVIQALPVTLAPGSALRTARLGQWNFRNHW